MKSLDQLQKEYLERMARRKNHKNLNDILPRNPFKKKSFGNKRKPVFQYDLAGNFIAEYESITEAAKAVEGSQPNISKCLSGKTKTSAGFIWKYK